MAEDIYINNNGVKVSVNDMKRYWRERPDAGFSEKRNKLAIANSIKRAEELRKSRIKDHHESIDERVSAVSSYLRYLDRGKSGSPEEYFGKKNLAELRGERVKAQLIRAKSEGKKLWQRVETKNA